MRASSFYMRAVREFYIFFLEIDAIFCLQTSSDLVFIESTEDLISLAFEGEFECLTFELFLDIECLEESHACLIGGSFFLCIDLLHTFWSDLFRESFRDEVVASLRRRDFDHLSMSTEIRDIDEELDGEFCWRHISRGFRIAQIYGKCDSLQEIIPYPYYIVDKIDVLNLAHLIRIQRFPKDASYTITELQFYTKCYLIHGSMPELLHLVYYRDLSIFPVQCWIIFI